MSYQAGNPWKICDRCGFKKRASATRKEWTGLIVCMECFEERHPQDFVRGRMDRQNVPEPRPEPVDNIIGPLTTTTTAAAVAGATTLTVSSSARFLAADRIGIMLTDGSTHRAVINTVPTATSITLTAATKLPGSVASGALIIDYSAVSTVSL